MSPTRKRPRLPLRGQIRLHGEIELARPGAWSKVFSLVRRIPRGRVMTYGQIAAELGSRLSPRAVGWALHGCPDDVPWHRVVNASGGCSTERLPQLPPGLQAALLRAEGVRFSAAGKLDLGVHRWNPRPRARARRSAAGEARRRGV
jgi:methylated-DNA-protein-cysteine methyltransferase related protein